jgi:phosphatidylglycerol---prolipoprotein diacylglyceryl transferase
MIDFHYTPENWGIFPNLFYIGNFGISSYSFFVTLGLIVGIYFYYIEAKRNKDISENSFLIGFSGIAGGIVGAKLLEIILNLNVIINNFPNIDFIFSGKTIIGGLLGGTFTVMIVKRKLKITKKRGNLFAPGIAIGVAIGRIGCLLRGCCYGIKTNLPWGINFGDGVLRHPTQIYESIFMLIMFFILWAKRKTAKPGQLFYWLMNSYFIFRFFEEFIREETRHFGFTLFQYISILALIFINLKHHYESKVK